MNKLIKILISFIFILLVTLVLAQPSLALESLSISEFTPPGTIHDFRGITSGSDGNIWYSTLNTGGTTRIGKITPLGEFTEYPIPLEHDAIFIPYDIASGPDGNLWFTGMVQNPSYSEGPKIGKFSPDGLLIGMYSLDISNSKVERITAGPDGNLWFTEGDYAKIGKITPEGQITEYALPSNEYFPQAITPGPDGNIWFTVQHISDNSCKIGKISTEGNPVIYPISESGTGCQSISSGYDGNLWFTLPDSMKIGRVTPDGSVTLPITLSNRPTFITKGPDGYLWFTESNSQFVGKIEPSGAFTELPISITGGIPQFITLGPDGNMWFTEVISNTKIGRINLVPVTPTPSPTPKPEPVYALSGIAVDHNQVPLDRLKLSITCGSSTRKILTDRQGRFRVAMSTKSNCMVGSTVSISTTRNGISGTGTVEAQKNGNLGTVTIPLLTDMEKKALFAIEWAKAQALKDQSLKINNYTGRCLRFVRDAWDKSIGTSIGKSIGNNDNPVKYWNRNDYPSYFVKHKWDGSKNDIPPAGALVIWGVNDSPEGKEGHVALSLGDGNVISTHAYPFPNGIKGDDSIFIFSIYNSTRNPNPEAYNLLGWIMPR